MASIYTAGNLASVLFSGLIPTLQAREHAFYQGGKLWNNYLPGFQHFLV
jgi:hypothetical protein